MAHDLETAEKIIAAQDKLIQNLEAQIESYKMLAVIRGRNIALLNKSALFRAYFEGYLETLGRAKDEFVAEYNEKEKPLATDHYCHTCRNFHE